MDHPPRCQNEPDQGKKIFQVVQLSAAANLVALSWNTSKKKNESGMNRREFQKRLGMAVTSSTPSELSPVQANGRSDTTMITSVLLGAVFGFTVAALGQPQTPASRPI